MTWIGLKKDNVDSDEWYWTDGTTLDYKNWAPGEPALPSELCVEMTSDPSVYNSDHHKNWDSYTCDTVMRAFVCKKVKDGDCQYDGNGDNLWQLDCHNGSWASYNPVSGIVQPVDEVGCYVPGPSLEEEKNTAFGDLSPEEQNKIIEDITYDPTLTRDYIPFLIGGYTDEVRKGLGYTAEETFYGASYEDKTFDISRDFTEIYDKSLGTCYTFNHENGSMHYKLRKPGMQEGLSVLLRVYPHEYLSWTVLSGFMVFVHDNSEAVVSDSPRINTRSGSHTNLLIDMTKYVRLGGRYGKCANSINEVKSFYYLGSYTTDVSPEDSCTY
ncbi:hypothetical protein WR25_06045 [Diploscapter pachys]|uniref:C-type lectin domain-containing protein n=1 Tax=Diploscapter pachys TaxID=2018661 RepID=A0A2A2J288_9BILA|nr:hypothetical protein WR25_06045 [Diploscapter pachys]